MIMTEGGLTEGCASTATTSRSYPTRGHVARQWHVHRARSPAWTHRELPREAKERYGMQLVAAGIARRARGEGEPADGDFAMISICTASTSTPGQTNPFIPQELIERDALYEERGAAQQKSAAAAPPCCRATTTERRVTTLRVQTGGTCEDDG